MNRKPSRRPHAGSGPATSTLDAPPGATGPAGPTGPTGPTGPAGPAGPAPAGSGYVHVTGGVLDAAVAAIPQADVSGLAATLALKAPLASPALTGTPTAPTAAGGTNTTQLATTAFTRAEIAALVASAPGTLDTLNELALALGSDPSFATTMTAALAGKASKAWTVLTPSTTGAVNDWAPGLDGHTVAFWNGAADLTPSGIAGGVAGQFFLLKNVTAAKVVYLPHNTGPTAANRTQNFVTSCATPVAPGGAALYAHDGSQWQIVSHVQGASIAGGWTDASGAGLAIGGNFSYVISGRQVGLVFQAIYPATASGAAAKISGFPFTLAAANAAASIGYQGNGPAALTALVAASTNRVDFYIQISAANATNAQLTNANLVGSALVLIT